MKVKKFLDAAIVFLVAVIIILFVSPLLTRLLGFFGGAIAELLLVAAAIGAILIRKGKITEGLSLRLPAIRSFFCSVLLIFGSNAWQNAAIYLYTGITGRSSAADLNYFQSYFADQSPFVTLVCIALIPAVCEELLFRGYLLNAFKDKKAFVGIVVTAVLFAVIHFDPFKLLPVLVMGLVYGFIAVKTGSVLLPIIFHFINNAMSVVNFYSADSVTEEAVIIFRNSSYLWMALGCLAVGSIFIYFGVKAFSVKKPAKRVSVIVVIVAIAIFFAAITGIMKSETQYPYSKTYQQQIRTDKSFSDSFVLDKNSMVMVNVFIFADKAEGVVTVTDSKGETVYEYSPDTAMPALMLEAGEYKVNYSFSVPENSEQQHSVAVSCDVITFAEYKISENQDN